MEGWRITDQTKKNSGFGFNLADEKMKLIDMQLEDDYFLVDCGDSFPEIGKTEQEKQDLIRRSLAWDSAFFNSAGVLDPDELSFINRGFTKTETHLFPGTIDVRNRRSESESTPIGHGFSADWFEVEPPMNGPMSCSALNVFDESPEPGLSINGVQDVQDPKKVDESCCRSKMKSYRTSIGGSINVNTEGKPKKELTSRRRNGATPSPLPQKAIGSATNFSTRLNNKENIFGKSYLKMDKRSTTGCSVLSVAHSIDKPIPASSAQVINFLKRETDPGKSRCTTLIPTSKNWRYSGRNQGMGNDIINASTHSLSMLTSKRMSIESKDAKEASVLKDSLESSLSSANSSQASSGTRLSTQALRPSRLRPPSPIPRFSREISALSYHGETRTRKLPQQVISQGTTLTGHGSACKKHKTPCSDVPKNTKRPKVESSTTSHGVKQGKPLETRRVVGQDNVMKKSSYSFDRLENLSKYFEAIDLNQGKRVNRPSVHNRVDVENHGVPVFSLVKHENQMRTPLSDKKNSCNFNGTSMEPKREKLAKKASSVYATSKVPGKEHC